MKFLAVGIGLLGRVREEIIEKIYGSIDADHVADVVVAHDRQCQRDNKKLISAVLDELFDRIGQDGKPAERIDPHDVALIDTQVVLVRSNDSRMM